MTLPASLQSLQDNPYQGYAYSYPHKTAYRSFTEPVPLQPLWEKENRDSLFFYLHLPFCEMRCGFCNLFTTTHPTSNLVGDYLNGLKRQLEVTADWLGEHRFAQAAFGGGTPSFLSIPELEQVFTTIKNTLGPMEKGIPTSFETSPATVDSEKLAFLKESGVTRLSIGVQSFVLEETKKLGRPQHSDTLAKALTQIRDCQFPVMNIDLIYGAEGQTESTWLHSLKQALLYNPEELYLYPLYVRPLTGLGKRDRAPSDNRQNLYRKGRDFLLENGYQQISMRLFRRSDSPTAQGEGPVYCCQEDGMIGFGSGARSYTQDVHYSSEYAVGRKGILDIIKDFNTSSRADFAHAHYGCHVSPSEQKRRFLIKSLLRHEGLDFSEYNQTFPISPEEEFQECFELLLSANWAESTAQGIALTTEGMAYSDAIGPWLFSDIIKNQMEDFELV